MNPTYEPVTDLCEFASPTAEFPAKSKPCQTIQRAAFDEVPKTEEAWSAVSLLERVFDVGFAILDAEAGTCLRRNSNLPDLDWDLLAAMARPMIGHRTPILMVEEDPVCVLAVPMQGRSRSCVAATPLIMRRIELQEDLRAAARATGCPAAMLAEWAATQRPWEPESALRVAQLVLEHDFQLRRLADAERETDELSVHLSSVYEEISLLHRLTQNLRLSKSDTELARSALEWLAEVIQAEGLGLLFLPVAEPTEELGTVARTQPELLSVGRFPFSAEEVRRWSETMRLADLGGPVVRNLSPEESADTEYPHILNWMGVAVTEGENVFGYFLAVNHTSGGQFGTVQANMLHSVASILGIHSGNIELYRQQAELLAGVIRALSSAIDAKDPYTCGHSDRVARIAVRLAQDLGYSAEALTRVYLAGLLHDIGKIGVNDAILQKPGKLSENEFEAIKTHPTTGFRILSGLRNLDDVMQVVLHHHESWDGRGYPDGLSGERIPPVARIVAVADSYDAMASNRPYRNRMPLEKIEEILRHGAGKQWDPAVVDAFFHAKDDIVKITESEDVDGFAFSALALRKHS
ncbi:HD domain-containing phosphohydrolase [Thermopirellula anaerolimosa]